MTKLLSVMTVTILFAGAAWAQPKPNPAPAPQPHPGGGGHLDPIHDRLFPPEMIMEHQQELGIDDKQRAALVKEIQATQTKVTEMQWQMQGTIEALGKMLDATPIDEAKVLAQADKVMNLESTLKKAHFMLLVRIKNLLTDAQRAKLLEIRAKRHAMPAPQPQPQPQPHP
jgi:Spy/CpxP family protein refolding chaperone